MCAQGCGGCNDCGGLECGTGPAGLDGQNAFTVTTANFTVPAISSNVTINVSALGQSTGLWALVGQEIFITGAGYYRVVSVSATTVIVATNVGTTGNAVATTVIALGAGVSPAGRSGATGSNGSNGQDGIAVLDHDLSINNTTSAAYAVVKTLAVSGNTIGTVDDAIKLSFDVIGDSSASLVNYDIRVQFDGNTMIELDDMIGSYGKPLATHIEIYLVVTAANTVTPYVTYSLSSSALRSLQFMFGEDSIRRYVDPSSAASITLSSSANITVELKSNGTNNVSMTYFQALKLKK
jgi:hypothetical protein